MEKFPIILGSSSPQRFDLLNQMGIPPSLVIAADINESPKKKETFLSLVQRLAKEKAYKVASNVTKGIIISADTIVVCKGRLLEKASCDDDVRKYLELLSGSKSKIHTSIYIIKKDSDSIIAERNRLVTSSVKFKLLTRDEIEDYIATKEGIGKSGGFAINGCAASYIRWFQGSYSGIVGLPQYETRNLLISLEYDCKITCKN